VCINAERRWSASKEHSFFLLFQTIHIILAQNNEMISQLLELSIIRNGNQLKILNTDMELYIDWDLSIKKNQDTANVFFILNSLKGKFEICTTNELYKKNSEYIIDINNTWKITALKKPDFEYYPESAIINFDEKSVIINY